jgi:hypothetical protein
MIRGLVILLSLAVAAAFQTPAKSRVILTMDKTEFLLGENVLVHYCFENTSKAPIKISYGGDYRGSSRHLRFKVTVTAGLSAVMPDPDPSGFSLGGIGGTEELADGGRFCQSLPLMRYARIERAGTYTIRVTHDLGLPAGEAPEGSIAVNLTMPTAAEAETVVAETFALPRDGGNVMGRLSTPFADFSTLRYQVYLSPLLRRAEAADTMAVGAIGSIPTPEATKALVELLRHSNPAVTRAAARTLSARLPDPALDGALAPRSPFDNEMRDPRRYLINASWRPEFAGDVRGAADRLLAAQTTEDIRETARRSP